MTLRFFVLDDARQLRKAPRGAVRAFLAGDVSAAHFGCKSPYELGLATVACDRDLLPRAVYLLRVPLTGGRFTPRDALVLRAVAAPDCVTPDESARHHGAGWPTDLARQFAIAMDVPLAGMDVPFAMGGPVLLAAARGLTIGQALRRLP